MPFLDAKVLETDPDGMDLLRSVLVQRKARRSPQAVALARVALMRAAAASSTTPVTPAADTPAAKPRRRTRRAPSAASLAFV